MNVNRRIYISRFMRVLALPVMGTLTTLRKGSAADITASITQPEVLDGKHMMQRAFDMRRLAAESGDQAFGAVIVKDDHIVGQAPSRVIVNNDPTAHAEMEAIRDAAQRLSTHELSGCTMYSSSQPCPMCEAAAYWARIERLVYSSELTDAGPPRLSHC